MANTNYPVLMQGLFACSAKKMSYELRNERPYWDAAYARSLRRAKKGQARHYASVVQFCMHEQYDEVVNQLIRWMH